MADLLGGTHVGGNLTLDGSVDGVDLAAFKSAYDSHLHDSRYLLEGGDTMQGVLDLGSNDLEDGTTTLWDASAGYIPQGRLQNSAVTVTAGNQLTGGGSVSLGGSITVDVNEGSGSGLDADLLDGMHAGDFVSESGDTVTGVLKVDGQNVTDHSPRMMVGSDADDGQVDVGFEVRGNTSGGGIDMSDTTDSSDTKFAILGDGSTYIGYQNLSTNGKTIGGPYLLDVNGDANFTGLLNEQGNRVATRTWVQNTSKLGDADTVDGNHASAFADSGHNHDGRYYTESEADSNFSPTGHLHDSRYIQDTGEVTTTLDAQNGIRVTRGSGGLSANNSIEAVSGDDWLGLDADVNSTGGVLIGYYNAPEIRLGNGGIPIDARGTLMESGSRVATRTWVGNNADVPNADYADSAGDADTVDGQHASDLGSDVSDGGSLVVSNATDINFGANINVSDDTDGTVTVDGTPGYTDESAQDAVGGILDGDLTYDDGNNVIGLAATLGVDITGDADTVDGNHASDFGDISEGDPIPHPTYATTGDAPALTNADVVHVSDDGLYIEQDYNTTVDDSGTPLQTHIDDNSNPHNVTTDQAGAFYCGYLSTKQSGANNGQYVNTFENAEVQNNTDFTKDSNSQITVNNSGKYRITFSCSWDQTGGDSRTSMQVYPELGGTKRQEFRSTCYIRNASSGDRSGTSNEVVTSLSSGDTVRIFSDFYSGSNNSHSTENATCTIQYLG